MKKTFYAALAAGILFISCDGNKSGSGMNDSDSTGMAADTSASAMTSGSTDNTNVKMGSDTMASGASGGSMANGATGQPITDKDVTEFVMKAGNSGMMEIELGNYAAQNAGSQRVKDFGSMMVSDHTKAANELKSMAMSNSIMMPAKMDAEHQQHTDMLKGKTGAAFDKEYMKMMVTGHKETIATFKKGSNLKEDSYKSFATKTLPTLQMHLDSAQAISKSM